MPRRPRQPHRPARASRHSPIRLNRRTLTPMVTFTSMIQADKWSMWPICLDAIRNATLRGVSQYNHDIRRSVSRYTYEPSPAAPGRTEIWETILNGKFDCINRDYECECRDKKNCKCMEWDSYSISTTIRHYARTKQFNVNILHQRCIICGQFGIPSLETGKFIKCVAQRLKIWNGLAEDTQPVEPYRDKGDHKTHLCEGCRRKTCHYGREADAGRENDEKYTFRG